MTNWSDYQCLHPNIIAALQNNKLTQPTHVQKEVFQHYMHYHDFLVAAQTGSGKTLAFSAPILSELEALREHIDMTHLPHCLIGLILTPTRELAQQIHKNIILALEVINSNKNPIEQIKVTCIIGGMSKDKQLRILQQRKPQIVIGTPGRLHQLLDDQILSFSHLKYLVIDQADRMIEMGHFKQIDQILTNIFQPKTKQFYDEDFHEVNKMIDQKALQSNQEFFIKEGGKKKKITLNLNALPADQLFEVPAHLFVFDQPQLKIKTKKGGENKQLKPIKEQHKEELSEKEELFLSKLKRRIFFVSATLTREFKGTKYFMKKAWTEEEWEQRRKERKEKRKLKEKQSSKPSKGKSSKKQEQKQQEGIQETIPKLKALLSRAKFSDKPKIIDQSSLLFLPSGLKEIVTFTQNQNERITCIINYLQDLPPGSKTILFANTIKSCKRVQFFVESFGIETVSLHSHMQQKQRLKKLEKFKKSTLCNLLIATDVAARGLDFNITHVVQMGVPVNGDTYVHRAGRTARANRQGQNLILVDKKQANRWTQINDIISQTMPNRQVSKYQPIQRRFNQIHQKVQQFDWIRRNQQKQQGQIQKHDLEDADLLGVGLEEKAPRKKYDLDKEEEEMVRHEVKRKVENIRRSNHKQKIEQKEEQHQWRKNRLVLSLDEIHKML